MTSKEDILRLTNNGLDIFRHYVPGDWEAGTQFRNPFYRDTKASFYIYYNRHEREYRMKDFGDERYSGDCFALVGLLHGWECARKDDFTRILEKIVCDLNLPVNAGSSLPSGMPSKDSGTTYITKEFSTDELRWWGTYGITKEVLKHFRVNSLQEVKFPRSTRTATAAEPMYLYRFANHEETTSKLYQPMSDTRFLYLKKAKDEYFGYAYLPDKAPLVVITGGEKDVLTLAAMQIPAFCLNSETACLPEELMKKLSERFEHITLLYDMDETGQRCSLQLYDKYISKYSIGRALLPLKGTKEEKDISDFARLRLAVGQTPAQIANEVNALLNSTIKDTYDQLAEEYAGCFIDCACPPQEPKTILRIHHEAAAAAGDLVCITGGSGTGKSNYADCILSGALNTMLCNIDTLGMQILPNAEQKALLLFDTEQSEYQSYKNTQRILHRARLANQPDCMKIINLCRVARVKRQHLIEQFVKAADERHHGIHSIIIDGLADLMASANDEEEAVRLIEWLHGLAQKYNTVIISVVHTAGIPEKVRGHIGSELTRKSSAVIDIETDRKKNCSIVKVLKLRAGSAVKAGISMFEWDERTEMHCSMVG